MKVGDLVRRRIKGPIDLELELKTGKYGLIVSKQIEGTPVHPCITVYWTQSGKFYGIAERLVEVVSESR